MSEDCRRLSRKTRRCFDDTPTNLSTIGHLQDPVTWYGINYTGTQMTQWDFQNKGKSGWTGTSSFVLKVPLRHLRPSVIYSVPCDWILQMAYLRDKPDVTDVIDISTCEDIISSHVRISYRFYQFVTTRYTTEFYIISLYTLSIFIGVS